MGRLRSESYLLISDIHMSNRLSHARPGPSGVTDRLQDQLNLWKRVKDSAEEHECKGIVIAGDLFDKSQTDAITLTETTRALNDISRGLKVHIIPGNHDAINTSGGRFTVEAFGAMGNDNIHYLKTGERVSFGDDWLGFWPMEYCSQEVATETIAAMQAKARALPSRKKRTEVLLIHQSIMGCEFAGDWKCDDGLDPDFICRDFNFVISGHFHKYQTFGPLDQGFYLGSPLHLYFDDAGRKAGYWIVTYTSDGQCERKFIPGGCPRFHELDWPAPAGIKPFHAGDYVRLNVESTASDWETLKPKVKGEVDKLKEKGIHASFKYKPLHQHLRRIAGATAALDSTLNPEAMAEAYLSAPSVDKGGLDKARLNRIAREALEAARAKMKGEKWAE